MANKGDNITVYCNKCNKFLSITDSGSFHTYVKCPDCGNSILKPIEKIRLKKLASRNIEFDISLAKEIVNISEPYLRRKTERELWEYHDLLTSYFDINGAKEQAELIMNILNEWDKGEQIQKEKEIAQHIVNHDTSLFERYDLNRLLKYKKILSKYRELDKNNKLRLIIELIIKMDKIGKYAKACKIELAEQIIDMPMYQLKSLPIEEQKRYKKYLDKSNIEGAKEQGELIDKLLKEVRND